MISRIIKVNNNRVFEIDGKIYPPAAFRSFRPTPANVSLFYRNGIRLFQMQCCGINNRLGVPYSTYGGAWIGDHQYDFSVLDRQMEMFMKYAPDGYFMLMPVLDMPDWWRKENDCKVYSFYQLTEASFEEKWISDACDYLKAFIDYAESKYGDRVFAYSFAAGRTTEWFDGSGAPSERKAKAFQSCVGQVPVPTETEIKDKSLPSLYDAQSHMIKYHRYCAEITPKLIERFASAVQERLNHTKPIGIFYGYATLPNGWQNQTATTGYEKVWENDDIDMIFAPAEYYAARKADGVSTYQNAVDSLAVHDKLYLHEIDHRTHLAKYPLETGHILDVDYENEDETIRVLRRELCAAMVKDAALWWFDFFGGYYASPGLEKEIALQLQIIEKLNKIEHRSVAEIAVFVDPSSFHYMKDESGITYDCVGANRDSLNNCGAPYDFFNQKDLTVIDKSKYKMFVFLNALELTDEQKRFVKQNLSEKTVVWVYAPNLYSGGISEVCGFNVEKIEKTDMKIQYKNVKFGFKNPTAPLFKIADHSATVFAYGEDGTPACAQKGNVFYLSQPCVPPVLWRDIAKSAGVHIYTENEGALYVDSRFIARQTMREDEITLRLPFDCTLYELFDGGVYKTHNKTLIYSAPNGATKLFLIGDRL